MEPDIHTLSDSLLWKRFLEGDSSAYTQIYNRTVQDLFRFGLLYTSDKELIKDCIHDVFVKIHMNRAKLADRKSTRLNSSHSTSSRMPSSA